MNKINKALLIAGFCAIIFLYSCTIPGNESRTLPNVLICIADDASFPHMGAYGTTWLKTPGFDRVASEGVLFMNAYTPNAKCAPSRATLLTGRNSWQLEEAANHWPHFPAKFVTFMEVLGENGYFVGHTAKGWGPGNPGEINGQRRLLTGKAFNTRTLEPPTKFINRNDYAGNFEDFMDERPTGQPFCFWYGSSEPHRGYEFGSSVRLGKSLSDLDKVPSYWPDNEVVRTDILDYAIEVEYFDQHIVKMLNTLEERGELENTIVIITSDHGMPFPRIKGQAYEMSNHVPLAIMWKNGIKNKGRKIDDFISFIDFAPTILELARIPFEASGMQPVEGRSFTDILFSNKKGQIDAGRDFVLIGKERHDVGRPNDWGYPIRGIIKGNYLYIKNYEPSRWPAGNPETGYLNTDGGATKSFILDMRRKGVNKDYWQLSFGKRPMEELYDISNDPDCINNLVMDEKHRQMADEMMELMESKLKEQDDPRMFGRGYVFDEYEYTNPSGVNFYERFMKGEKMNSGWVNDNDFEREKLD
jgi:N-sulfoglucosamine sulfohydrolase